MYISEIYSMQLRKSSEFLQLRMESLLERKKTDQLSPEEVGELDDIGELDRIFTHINAMITAQNTHQ
jgi:hypothetical protein